MKMVSFSLIALLFGLAELVASPPALAAKTDIETVNHSNYRAWITIQDLGKTRNLDWGFVDPKRSRAWRAGNYVLGSLYYVRFQFQDHNGKDVCDTRGQVYMRNEFGITVDGYYDPGTRRCYVNQPRP